MIDDHETICNVLEQIRSRARDMCSHVRVYERQHDLEVMLDLIDEAKDYAQRMSAKLVEYKREKNDRDNRNN